MTRSKYFLLSCLCFIFGIAIGSFYSFQIWVLLLVVGFSVSLIFLLKIRNISSDGNHLGNMKNIPFDKNDEQTTKKVHPDEWGLGFRGVNLASSSNKLSLVLLIFIIFFSLGFIRVESNKLTENEISSIENLDRQEVFLVGKIQQSPAISNGKQKILLGNVVAFNIKNRLLESGDMIIYLERYPEYNIGDKISFEGKLDVPEDFDGFEYKNYLFSKGIYYTSYYPKVNLVKKADEDIYIKSANYRKRVSDVVRKIYSQPEAGIINAMVLGEKSDLSDETLESFNRTGTRHIIAISGIHMTIIGILIMYLLLALGLNRNYAFYLAVLGITSYVTLVGFPPSAVRASVMSFLILLAVKVGRLSSAGNAIVVAGTVMLFLNPNMLRYDTGFQLSFLAVLGIIYIFPRLDFHFKKYPDHWKIKSMFLITISAQIATFPIIINSFGQFSIFSVFANILVLPFVPVVMVGGIISILAGFVNLFLGQIIALPILFILSLQLHIIRSFAGFEIGFFSFENISIWFGIVYYGILIFVLSYKRIKKGSDINQS